MNRVLRVVVIGPESTGKSTLCQQLAAHYNTLWCPEYAREYLLTHGITYTYDDLLIIAKGQIALEVEYEARVRSETLIGKSEEGVRSETAGGRRDGELSNNQPVSYLLEDGGDTATVRNGEVNDNDGGDTADTPSLTQNIKPRKQDLLFIDTDMYVMKVWSEYLYGKCPLYILEQIATRKYDLYFLCNPDLPWEPDILREHPDEASRLELYRIYKNLLLHQATPFVEIAGNYSERLYTAIQAVDALILHNNQ